MTLKPVLILMAAGAIALAATPSFARSGNTNPGGASASHMSAQGKANTNGPNAADRDKGLDRAEDRKSAQGLAHSKAKKHASKQHGKKKGSTTQRVGGDTQPQ